MTILLLHGLGGKAAWQEPLKQDLIKLGHQVIMPSLPNSDNPDRQVWLDTIKLLLTDVDHSQLIIVGHSLGVPAGFDYLEQADKPIKAFVSVAGFLRAYGFPANQAYLEAKAIDPAKIKSKVQQVFVYYGDDDPYVTQEALAEVAPVFGVSPRIYPHGGHLSASSGYNSFPEMTRLIKGITAMDKTFIDKLAYIDVQNKQVLSTMSQGKDVWYLPGGKREGNETDFEALMREVAEELSVKLKSDTIRYYGTFEAQAHGKPAGTIVRMTCYTAKFDGQLQASAEVAKYAYVDYSYREKSSPVDQLIFDDLMKKGLIK